MREAGVCGFRNGAIVLFLLWTSTLLSVLPEGLAESWDGLHPNLEQSFNLNCAHSPPLAVVMPRSLRPAAICLKLVAPCTCIAAQRITSRHREHSGTIKPRHQPSCRSTGFAARSQTHGPEQPCSQRWQPAAATQPPSQWSV